MNEQLKYGGEDRFKHVFHALGAETIDDAKVRTLSAGNPLNMTFSLTALAMRY
uniref:hypothetical protein n=1 Tax=Cohnella cholangitidis TaxID=2598458 RepID=UPI0015FD1CFF|nr:hypothetical protein [Cohnella cholangitidis]